MIRSGKEWVGDSDRNTSASDRPEPAEGFPAQLSNEEYRILSQCVGLCAHELTKDESEVLDTLIGDGLAWVDEINGVIGQTEEGSFAVRNWEPADDNGPWSGGFAENH